MTPTNHPAILRLQALRIIPVIAIDRTDNALPLARALTDGGLPCAEITFRTEAAEASIRAIAKEFPEMALGAGTVLTTEQVDRAIGAGATYIVSPGINPKVVEHCQERGVPITPGVMTPSEVEQGLALGLSVLKFFPAEAAGGVPFLNALSAPYKMARFIPTGGISASNLRDYLTLPNVVACGGSWMVRQDLIASGRFEEIRSMTAQAVALAGDIR